MEAIDFLSGKFLPDKKPSVKLPPRINEELKSAGIISEQTDLHVEALAGGVSSEICKVTAGDCVFVIKQALSQLKVASEWLADTDRNKTEVAYLRYVGEIYPKAVPEVYYQGQEFFVMEYFDSGFQLWKNRLLRGQSDHKVSSEVGKIIGGIHETSFGDSRAKTTFDTAAAFRELRTCPYFETIAWKYPEIRQTVLDECDRLLRTEQCLVHGDLSPKNIIFCGDRIVLLDCEVAWYGDPAFDLAFLLTHLFLKALYHSFSVLDSELMVDGFLQSYYSKRTLSEIQRNELEKRVGRLLPMLLLARVDGKSPVEYLTRDKQDWIRSLVIPTIVKGRVPFYSFRQKWFTSR
jgi:5-methylthioribose kinase